LLNSVFVFFVVIKFQTKIFFFLNGEEISQKSQCGFQVSSPKRLVARVLNLFMLGMLLNGFVALIHAGIKEAFESS